MSLVLVTVAAAVGVVSASPAQAAVTGSITSPAGVCVDVSGGSSANGTPVRLWSCNGTAAQQWTTQRDGTVHALGKCLNVADGNTAHGTPVQLWDCNGGSAQTWVRSSLALINPASGMCLNAADGGAAAGTLLQIWDCNATGAQQWILPAGSDVLASGWNDAQTFQPSGGPGANSFDCRQHRDDLVVSGGKITGTANTMCDIAMTDLHLLVELFWNGHAFGEHGEDRKPGENFVKATARAPCRPGFWYLYSQTLEVPPPGYFPPVGISRPLPSELHTTFISPAACLPTLLNMSDGDARNSIAQMGLRVGTVTHQPSSTARVNSIISSSLEADNTTVDLVEALGISVPPIHRVDWMAAVSQIRAAGLVVGNVTTQQVFQDADVDKVMNEFPASGTRVDPGSAVNIIVGHREDPPPPPPPSCLIPTC